MNKMALTSEQLCHHYSLADIQSATQNFDERLVVGRGGFGKVYKGQIKTEESSSTVVAIKRLDSMSQQGETEFRAEIEMLSRLRHSHLVSLIGCCVDHQEMILVYDYMPQGTLYQHLHKSSSTPLSWRQRLRISIGAARGLDYLHTGAGTKHGVIHSDVKSSNILLDEDLDAKISDFGLAKLCPTNQSSTYVNTRVKGTFGYLDPEFYMTGKLTRKTDVFAFGVVLFELLSGRHAVFQDEDLSLARWAQRFVKKGKLNEIVSAEIRRELSPKSLKVFAQIADRCLHTDPKERPTISEVVAALQLSESLQGKFDSSGQASGIFGFIWKKQKNSFSVNFVISPKVQGIKRFSYSDLKDATRNFQNPIMRSGRGSVTKGWVDKETYSPSKQDDVGLAISVIEVENSIQVDTDLLGKFSHPNLVNLLGYCFQDITLYLVHEFMEKTSFKDYLHKGAATEHMFPRRLQIALGVAHGLVHLESKQLINKKWLLETDDIWLDKEFNAKLVDFDSAMLTNRLNMRDGLTYDPNSAGLWWQQLRLCDVNGLGMLLMELLTGDPVPGKLKMDFLWKKHLWGDVAKMSHYMIENVVDHRIKLNAPQIEEAHKLLFLIRKCTRDKYTMERALNKLEQICCRVTQM